LLILVLYKLNVLHHAAYLQKKTVHNILLLSTSQSLCRKDA